MIKILRGTAVAEIPVEQPTAFELVINLRTAKTANLDLATGIVGLPTRRLKSLGSESPLLALRDRLERLRHLR
jgi:ABC-type uncharacterized transport system substrate-binding protein